MWHKGLREVLLGSPYVRGFIGVRFSALIATDDEGAIKKRGRGSSISRIKGDSVPEVRTLPPMKQVILARNDPAIIGTF